MYGAYYPYLYGRGAARSFHHAPHFQYDRLNVQAGNGSEYGAGAAALSSGSASSGAQSPASPPHAHPAHHSPRLRAKEEDLSAHGRASADGGGSSESEGECGAGAGRGRAQYVSANCVVFTHYAGDVAAVVDEHFARALAIDKPKESVPLASRNLPASFFNAAACGAGGAGGPGGPGAPGCGLELYEYDPWHQPYGYARDYQHVGYGGLLLGRGGLHAQYKPVEWGAQHAHLDPAACAPYSYPAVPGLEAQVQDTSKDLYWF
ncbi:PREDICTED: protein vestigial [Papilio xuthus]|uniref:Protein vestigial n=1 Tax=Papilio xuthus TaxID=66420 RepID=A0AAJ6ZRY1_PAPXU|nr:PREDICTED: protein vestigial [Papilio xuthus]